jgi:beta-lactam-binding protein with PASTA domain
MIKKTAALAALAALVAGLGSLLVFAAPAQATTQAGRVVVPNVVGMRMDRATRTLHSRGLRVNEECSGLFGCIVKSRWWVCYQSPRAGTKLRPYRVVVIYAERRGEC